MKKTIVDGMKARQILFCLAAPLLLHAAGTPARADTGDTRVRLVETADLDLRSSADRRELDRRIAQAARFVCGPESMASATFAICAAKARRSARPLTADDCIPVEEASNRPKTTRPPSFGPRAPLVPGN